MTDLWDEAFPEEPLPERTTFHNIYQDLVSAVLAGPAGNVAGAPPTGAGTTPPV